MSKESAYVPAPFNGISQSAPQVRLPEHAEELTNCLVDLPDGWRKRPPLRWLGELRASGVANTARVSKVIDPEDSTLKFLLVSREGSATVPRLYAADLSATSVTIAGAAQTYLNLITQPRGGLRVSSVVDYTFLTNRTHTITVDPTPVASRAHEALVFVKSGAFGKKYEVTITKAGGTPRVGHTQTPNGDNAADSEWTGTDLILEGIFGSGYSYSGANGASNTSIAADLVTDGFTVTRQGAVAHITHPTLDFTISTRDEQGGVAMISAKGTINKFEDLPKTVPVSGFTIKVLPTRGDAQGAYWVKFTSTPSPGIWEETVAPGSEKGILLTDMPVGLYKDSSSVWQLGALPWTQRTVGDEETAIDPLFVGDTIQDIGYSFGRLLIVSNEEVYLTAADDPFRIYPATLTTVIDSDPISLIPPTGAAQFKSATPFASDVFEGAFITGCKMQCALRSPGDGPVTPTSVKLNKISSYELREVMQTLRPIGSNSKIYLPVPLGETFMGIREMKLDRVSGETMGDDLTAATPKLLTSNIDIGATIETGYMALYGTSGSNVLRLHIFRYANAERVQNGIFTWTLPEGWSLIDIVAHETIFYLFCITSAGRCCAFTMDTNPQALDEDADSTILTRWDLRQSDAQVVSSVYNATSDYTTITSNVDLASGYGYVSARSPSTDYPEGYLAEVLAQPTATTLRVRGDWTSQAFYLGVSYTGYWKPSRLRKFSQGGDQRVVHSPGDLTLSHAVFDLSGATGLLVRVAVGNRSTRDYRPRLTTFGTPSIFSGDFRVKLAGKSKDTTIEIIDDGHIGATVSGFEWFGNFQARSRRTT